jgi:soluble lytic murein transglycosylase-like protein
MRFANHKITVRGGSALYAVLGVTLIFVTTATAEVIEIRPDGVVVTYAGPTSWSPDGSSSLQRQLTNRASEFRKPSTRVALALHAAATRHQLGDDLLRAVAWRESQWNGDAVSPKGARGVMQLMPATAAALHVSANEIEGNVDGGARYLSDLMQRFHGDLASALAAYNAGPAAVVRYGGVPPYSETQKYVAAVLDTLADFSLNQQQSGSLP